MNIKILYIIYIYIIYPLRKPINSAAYSSKKENSVHIVFLLTRQTESPVPPPARPPERGVRGAQPPGKRKKRVYINIQILVISIYYII